MRRADEVGMPPRKGGIGTAVTAGLNRELGQENLRPGLLSLDERLPTLVCSAAKGLFQHFKECVKRLQPTPAGFPATLSHRSTPRMTGLA